MSETPSARSTGMSMFVLYLFLYGGFIGLNVLRPDIMATRVRDTVTVAVAYGMLLIVVAAVLALLYVFRAPR